MHEINRGPRCTLVQRPNPTSQICFDQKIFFLKEDRMRKHPSQIFVCGGYIEKSANIRLKFWLQSKEARKNVLSF
ncbi:hypothetical protein C5167_034249 [Papaver somniferum]|uniref:Uncharacterized protein n=1 Tax=Papaver somniferum TaxID=3469 RepID=A0A4Y7KFW6_PAPSO|nr:hypothetical protein C5167_034249 [Papaver somniferum]